MTLLFHSTAAPVRICAAALAALAAMLVLLGVSAHARAETPDPAALQEDAKGFVTALVAELSGIADDAARPQAERTRAFRDRLGAVLSIQSIGETMVGEEARAAASAAQIARYEAALPAYIAADWAAQIDLLARRRIVVQQTRYFPQRPTEVLVLSRLINENGRPAARIDWRMRQVDGQWRLEDVFAERISQLVTRRSEISTFLEANGWDALLAEMEAAAAF